MSSTLMNVSLALGLATLALFAGAWLFSVRSFMRIGEAALAATTVALTVTLIHRWIAAGRAPFTNLYESVLLFAWSIAAVALLLRFAFRAAHAGPIAALGICVSLGYASSLDSSIGPLMPALRSNWLLVHVTASLVAYGAFALSFGEAAWSLVRRRGDAAAAESAQGAASRAAAVGFLFLTVGIATGAIWAKQAWGAYWGWDPKETWSLVTWLIYAAHLHLRFARGWKGAAGSWFLIAGFAAVVFTYFGVTYLMKGLHSYA